MERTSIFSWIFGEWFPDRCSQPALPLPCRWRVRAFPERQSCRPRRAPRSAFLLVLIGLDAANVGFVNLDDAGQLVEFGTARLAQPVQQKPCRLLRDADLFRQLQAADPLPGRDEQVHRIDPLVQRDMRPLHDGAGANREVLLALTAAVIAALACRDPVAETANRAARAVRTEVAFQPQPARFRVRNHLEKLVRGNGALAHAEPLDYAPIIVRKSRGVKYIIPLNFSSGQNFISGEAGGAVSGVPPFDQDFFNFLLLDRELVSLTAVRD